SRSENLRTVGQRFVADNESPLPAPPAPKRFQLSSSVLDYGSRCCRLPIRQPRVLEWQPRCHPAGSKGDPDNSVPDFLFRSLNTRRPPSERQLVLLYCAPLLTRIYISAPEVVRLPQHHRCRAGFPALPRK